MRSDLEFVPRPRVNGRCGCDVFSPTALEGKEVHVIGESPVWSPVHWARRSALCVQDYGCPLCEAGLPQGFRGWAAVRVGGKSGLLAAPAAMVLHPSFQSPGDVVEWPRRRRGDEFTVAKVGHRPVGAVIGVAAIRRSLIGVFTSAWLPSELFSDHLLGDRTVQDLVRELGAELVRSL